LTVASDGQPAAASSRSVSADELRRIINSDSFDMDSEEEDEELAIDTQEQHQHGGDHDRTTELQSVDRHVEGNGDARPSISEQTQPSVSNVPKPRAAPSSVPSSRRRPAHEHRRHLSITTSGANPLANAAALAAEQRLDPHADVTLEAPTGRETLKRATLKGHHSIVRAQPTHPPPLVQRLPLMSETRVQKLLSKFVSVQRIRNKQQTQDIVDEQSSLEPEPTQDESITAMEYETITIVPSSTGAAPRVIHSNIPLMNPPSTPSAEQTTSPHSLASDNPISADNVESHSNMHPNGMCVKGRTGVQDVGDRSTFPNGGKSWYSIASPLAYEVEQKEESAAQPQESSPPPASYSHNNTARISAWAQRPTKLRAQQQEWAGMMVGKATGHVDTVPAKRRSLSPPRSHTRPPTNRTRKPFASIRKRIQQMTQPSVINSDVHLALQVQSARYAGERRIKRRIRKEGIEETPIVRTLRERKPATQLITKTGERVIFS